MNHSFRCTIPAMVRVLQILIYSFNLYFRQYLIMASMLDSYSTTLSLSKLDYSEGALVNTIDSSSCSSLFFGLFVFKSYRIRNGVFILVGSLHFKKACHKRALYFVEDRVAIQIRGLVYLQKNFSLSRPTCFRVPLACADR